MSLRRPLFATAIAALLLSAGCAPKESAPLDQQIESIISAAHKDGQFNGNVLVTRGERTIYEQSFGLADVSRNIRNTSDTRFVAFSVLKPLTAILVFQLIDGGKLRLEDNLASFFSNLEGGPAGRITLQQLLTHTSGVPEVISDHLDRRITARDLEGVQIPSAGEFEYSNTGYVILGLVLEAATGRSYETLLREAILEPARMSDSGLYRTDREFPNLANGYHLEKGQTVASEMGVAMEVLDGAGSFYTTARDLWRLDSALSSEKILSRRMQELMLTQQIKGRYGYGWFLKEQGGRYFPWHKGDYRGYAAMFVRQIQRNEVVVILSNLQEADVTKLRDQILRVLKANPDAPP